MNEHRLRMEIAALREKYTVRANLDAGIVDLVRIEYPSMWTPERGTLRYDIPPDYGVSPPTVHIPAESRYRGQRDIIRKKPSRFDGWNRWCVRFNGWQPGRHTLVTVTRQMMGSLSDPSKNRLFRE